MGKKEGVDKFVLVSSAGVGLNKTPPALALDESQNKKDEARGRWRPTKLEPALLNEDVVLWKLRGEELLKTSGIPYTIVRSYSPPPRPWNDPKPEDFNIAIFPVQGDGEGISGVINRSDLGKVAAQALASPKTAGRTFEAINVPKTVSADQVSMVQKINPTFPNWKESLNTLAKDQPVSTTSSVSMQISEKGRKQEGVGGTREVIWDGDTMIIKTTAPVPTYIREKKTPVISFE